MLVKFEQNRMVKVHEILIFFDKTNKQTTNKHANKQQNKTKQNKNKK